MERRLTRIIAAWISFAFVACRGQADVESPSSPYLAAAVSAGRSLQDHEQRGGHLGIPDDVSDDSVHTAGLGVGSAGRLIFFLELFYATGDSTFLESARVEGDAAIALTEGVAGPPGLYNGLGGLGFALNELARVAQDSSAYRKRAIEQFEAITTMAEADEQGVRWGNSNDILVGTAGIGLALLYAAREIERPDFLVTAIEAGRALVSEAEEMERGIRWSRFTDRELDLPNFSHGTAGVAYFMSELFAATGDSTFLTAAQQGADYLASVADTTDGLFLVPYGIPDEGYVTKYDIGWGNGPAGTARLFFRLWQLTANDAYRRVVAASARSIVASGAPGGSSDTLRWADSFSIDRRFGIASLIPFVADVNRAGIFEGGTDVLRASADTIRARATASESGIYWTVPRFGFQGEGNAVYTGYFYGAAGVGLALLEMYYAENGDEPSVRLPDDPF